ncbi:hypothetical protein [Mycolicibacterium brisbanense]|uniref:Chitin-binding protein n=1 Tax=Mycolicibacterium brisbanense TaxID=146020 RepID=A0A100W5N9_9MYCO|nr:hypothetical protein [Mycolicibacterium brisbanense]MCV7162492.1 hypothetical protein [Mycolicibacterium brisbanense]GAS92098.1 uncharacterized protein RMCB_6194 [Mycolicibacterium brisbanense]
MNIKRLTCASAATVAVGAATLALGAGVASAQPGPPPCNFGNCQGPGPGGPGPGGAGPGGQDHRGPDNGPGDPGRWQGDPGGPDRGPGGPDRGPGGPGGWPGGDDHRGDHRWDPPPPPPPDLSWRGIDQGRWDHQPFNYNGNWVTPVFDPGYNAWGFWLFGIWIPL